MQANASAGSASRMAGAGEAEANTRELGSTGAGGGAESFGTVGAGALQSQPRQLQESDGFTDSQQVLPAQHEPVPQQEAGAAFGTTG